MPENILYNESELLLKIAEGDEKAFEILFNHHRKQVYSFALRLTGDNDIAREITQDTFLKVWLKRPELVTVNNFGGWIYTIAERFTYNALLKNTREKTYFDRWLSEAQYTTLPEDGNDKADDRDYQAILSEAVNRLPPKQKETYHLLKEQGFTRAEAAEKLQVSAETVKWNLERAMSSIRNYCISRLRNPASPATVLFLLEKYF